MPTPYPNAFQGLSQGLTQGLQTSLMMQQFNQQKKTQQLDDSLKAIQLMGVLVKDPHVPKSYKAKIMPSMTNHISNVLESLGGQRIEWDGNLDDNDILNMTNVSKLIEKVSKNEIPIDQAGPILQSWVDEIEGQNEPSAAKAIVEQQSGPVYSKLMDIQPGMGQPSSAMERPYLEAGLSRMNPTLHQKYIEDARKKEGMGLLGMLKSEQTPATARPDITEAIANVTPEYLEKPASTISLSGFGDRELVKKTLAEIPKLKREAITAENISTQIDTALDLVKTGVTGKGGQVKAFLAPYAEMLGADVKNVNDAQTFQLLTRAIIGPMRLEIVGPGPVSEWEQKLMQQISGGGGAAKPAAIALLSHWKKLAESKITNYNDTLEGLSGVYPQVKSVHKKIGGIKSPMPKTPEEAKSSGKPKTWEELKKQKGDKWLTSEK